MTSKAGVLRSSDGLREAIDTLDTMASEKVDSVEQEAWETTNLHTVSTLLASAALLREETRGSHWREDFPGRDDAEWSGHIDWVLVDGHSRGEFRSAEPSDAPLEAST
jgi:L-aspartate oxidase